MEWMIDPAHSMIEFRAKHMMFTTVRGQFTSFQRTLDLDKDNPQNSHVEGSVEVAAIDTGEKDRDTHLRSEDFFAVEREPRMTFRSTRIEPQGNNTYKVQGDLTVRGTTRPITWDVEAAERGGWDREDLEKDYPAPAEAADGEKDVSFPQHQTDEP